MQPLPTLLNRARALNMDDVHLWLLDFRRFNQNFVNQSLAAMSDEERQRAQKFIRGKDEYIASRWLLRRTLGHYLQQPPETLMFSRHEKGKPFIPGCDLQFNLSHSGPWAVLAVTRKAPVGVDVELGKQTRDLMGIATNYYHPQETGHLQTLAPEQQAAHFYRLWTLKEALLKATGVGISAGLEYLNFHLEQEITVDLSPLLPTPFFTHKWQFQQWQLPHDSLCALAIGRENLSSASAANMHATSWFDAIDTAF